MRNIIVTLANQRQSAYRAGSYDKLQAKITILDRDKLSYLKNIPVELYLNYPTTWTKYVDSNTENDGSIQVSYSCYDIYNIECCLGYARALIDGEYHTSNTVRFNFMPSFSFGGDNIEFESEYFEFENEYISFGLSP